MAMDLITTLGAIVMIFLWMIPFKENILSRIGEFTFIGLGMGITLFSATRNLLSAGIEPFLAGEWALIVPIVLGLVLIARVFSRSVRNLALWPLAMMLGYAIGAVVGGQTIAQVWKQMLATAQFSTATPLAIFEGVIVLVIVVCGVLSFTTTIEHEGTWMGTVAEIGRWGLMMAFGLGFGSWIMSRIGMIASLYSGPTQNLSRHFGCEQPILSRPIG
jgi:hypothetical protein